MRLVKAAYNIGAALLALAPALCAAQAYPSKPVRFVAPYPPGGPNDLIARVIAQRMTQAFAQTWIVENRPGRGGNIGVELVAKALPDGYTVVHGGMGSLTLAPFLSKLPYDALRDIVARLHAEVTRFLRTPAAAKPFAVHGADAAFSTANELTALIKSDLALWGTVIRENNIQGE